jgi:GNAT superfamily N-acetyltransferase
MTSTDWAVARQPVTGAVAADLLRRYFFDVASSYYGRPATDSEVATALADEPSDDLVAPTGVFLVGAYRGTPSGCAGVRFGVAGFAELTRMFVAPAARRTGGAALLLAAAEATAMAHDAHTIRLDTRLDLTAARALYVRHGYREVPAYSTGAYAQCWYGKPLS